MQIIALEDEPSSSRGGQELNLVEICRGLSQRGHSISLLYVKEGNLLEKYRGFCDRLINVDGYELNRKRMAHLFNFLLDIQSIPVRKDSVIFSSRYHDAFFGSTLSLYRNIPLVCYLQLPKTHELSCMHAIGLKGVKQFVAVSNQTKLDWIKGGFEEKKIAVVYNGTDPELFQPTQNFSVTRKEWDIPEDTRVISYIGRLDREKGLETLIKAFALLCKSGFTTRLLIAGKPVSQDEEYQNSLKQLVIDLGIENCVYFLGHVSHTTSVYQVSDVTVLPSIWSEPFGRTIVESMACGTPVVASRIGGIPEILTGEFQNGLFEPENERDLSTTLKQTMYWRENDPQLGKRCREHVLSKFTIDKMVDGIEKVLLKNVK
jgi:glycosyltransferase involved in cell wall biosynthesis